MLTDDQLARIMPNLAAAKRTLYLPHLNAAMASSGVDTLLRTAAFVAQLAHESGEFRFMEEIWGPTVAQTRYEPPSDLAARLGNTRAGDGKRFKGRGPIQITGRANYAKFGDLLGIDLTLDPARAAAPEVAFATAGLYWVSHGLNELADQRDFVTITRRINGGLNGLADRQMYYARAQAVLAEGTERAATREAPLMRGHETIVSAMARAKRAPKPTPRKTGAGKAAAAKPAVRRAAGKKAADGPRKKPASASTGTERRSTSTALAAAESRRAAPTRAGAKGRPAAKR